MGGRAISTATRRITTAAVTGTVATAAGNFKRNTSDWLQSLLPLTQQSAFLLGDLKRCFHFFCSYAPCQFRPATIPRRPDNYYLKKHCGDCKCKDPDYKGLMINGVYVLHSNIQQTYSILTGNYPSHYATRCLSFWLSRLCASSLSLSLCVCVCVCVYHQIE